MKVGGSAAQRRPRGGVLPRVVVADVSDEVDEALRRGLEQCLDAGFASVVAAHQNTVISVAARMTGRREDAEDLAAEAFLRAWRALRGYDTDRIAALRIRPWLVTIVLNLARNSYRDASRRPRETVLSPKNEQPAKVRDVAELVSARSARDELAARLAALPERERAAVVLRHVVELPIAEIAEILACPEGTARSHVARGLERLRAGYGDAALPRRSRANAKGSLR